MKKVIFLSLFFAGFLQARLPTVTIVTTGGTIAEKTDPKTGASVPALSGKDLIGSVPVLSKVANIEVYNFSNIDSSQMTPQMWADLSRVVDNILKDDRIKGVVVTHGTDTMSEGAYFLDLTIKSRKPVVFVGAMKNSSDPFPDGPDNLLNGVIQVCSNDSYGWGVTVTMNQYINSSRDVVKTQTTNVQTFQSGEKGYLGYIFDGRVLRFNNRMDRIHLDLPKKLPKVILYTDYAGSDGMMLRSAVEAEVDGIVIESLGAGNVNSNVFEAVKEAIDKKIPVVVTTRVYYGGVFPIYGGKGGGKTLKDVGAIVSGDLRGPKARLLLMLAIGNVGKDVEKLQRYFRFY